MKKRIGVMAFLIILIGAVYPLYVIVTVRSSGPAFMQVINSHDLQRYDRYFSPDTIFVMQGERIPYSAIRNALYKMDFDIEANSFYSPTDVPFDTKYTEYFTAREFLVGLHGGIVSRHEGKTVHTGMDGLLVLQRQGLLFRIKEVDFTDVLD